MLGCWSPIAETNGFGSGGSNESTCSCPAPSLTERGAPEQDEGDAFNEIRNSKLALEELLGDTVELFAYPNGQPTQDYNRAIRDMLPEIGFTGAVNTAPGVASSANDPFQLPRYTPWRVSRPRFLPDLLWMRRRLYRPAF